MFTFLFIRLPGYHTKENAIAVVARIRVLSLSLSFSLNALAYLSAFHSIFRNPSIQVIDSVSSDTPCMYMCAAHIVSVCVTLYGPRSNKSNICRPKANRSIFSEGRRAERIPCNYEVRSVKVEDHCGFESSMEMKGD